MTDSLVEVTQADRRAALVERLGTIADLLCSDPLPGEMGDVAYDLLREAAAQIASDQLALIARHRIASEQSSQAQIAAMREALADARGYVANVWEAHGDEFTRRNLAKIDAALSASPEEPDVDAQRDLAWGRNAVAFIRERGLEADFNNWCGGWPCPVAAQERDLTETGD